MSIDRCASYKPAIYAWDDQEDGPNLSCALIWVIDLRGVIYLRSNYLLHFSYEECT